MPKIMINMKLKDQYLALEMPHHQEDIVILILTIMEQKKTT